MASNFAIGDKVFVPVSRLPGLEDHPSAFYEAKVASVAAHKIKVNLPQAVLSEWIGTSLCHKNIGILIFSIGDMETESTLLEPLTKSVVQYCRLLVSDDFLQVVRVRSLAEISHFWRISHGAYSHVILIGHGSPSGIKFGVDGWVKEAELAESFNVDDGCGRIFLSLCCKTGYKSIGGKLSESEGFSHFIGPFHSVHGAIASQFAQTFLAFHFLVGESVGVAFKHARSNTPGSTSFRLWQGGNLKAGPKS
jgi:hypothetical protein